MSLSVIFWSFAQPVRRGFDAALVDLALMFIAFPDRDLIPLEAHGPCIYRCSAPDATVRESVLSSRCHPSILPRTLPLQPVARPLPATYNAPQRSSMYSLTLKGNRSYHE